MLVPTPNTSCVPVRHQRERERGFYIFSQPTRSYRCASVVSDLVRTSVLNCHKQPHCEATISKTVSVILWSKQSCSKPCLNTQVKYACKHMQGRKSQKRSGHSVSWHPTVCSRHTLSYLKISRNVICILWI